METIRWFALASLFLSTEAHPFRPMLIGGTKAGPDEWKSVIFIKTNISSGCLATVVGPRAFLTSASCSSTGSNATFVVSGKTFTAKITQSPLFFKKDAHPLAVGVTTEDIPLPPATVSTASPAAGVEVTLVGTGCTAAGPATEPGLFASKALISAVQTRTFDTSASGGPLICLGDRGGPAFVQSGTSWQLLGINSGVATSGGKITGPNSSARVDGAEHRAIITKIATDNSVDVCGVTKDCTGVTPGEPSCAMTAAPPSVRLGDAVTLSIASANAVSATIDGSAATVPSGTRVFFPPSLGNLISQGTATGFGGKVANCSVNYTVVPKSDPGPLSCTLTATPKKLTIGDTLTLEITASAGVTAATIDGTPVKLPSDKITKVVGKKGDFSSEGFVSGGGSSAKCFADYHVDDSGIPPTIPNYGVAMSYCGADANVASTGIARVCLGVLKKDPSTTHTGFTDVVHVKYASGTEEVLPIIARRPVGGSTVQDELGLFTGAVASGTSGATMDMRLATVSKGTDGKPTTLEGATKTNKNFRAALTAQ